MACSSEVASGSSSIQPGRVSEDTVENFPPWVSSRNRLPTRGVNPKTLTDVPGIRELLNGTELIDNVKRRQKAKEQRGQEFRERNRNIFDMLKKESPGFFVDFPDPKLGELKLTGVLGFGAQANIYSASIADDHRYAVKAFEVTPDLDELKKLWPLQELLETKAKEKNLFVHPGDLGLSVGSCYSTILYGTILKTDGSFAFVMDRYSMDLGKVIEMRMEKNTYRAAPFDLHMAMAAMWQIGTGIYHLHNRGIVHKDIKSSNVLVGSFIGKVMEDIRFSRGKDETLRLGFRPLDVTDRKVFDPLGNDQFACYVGDFESSNNCAGTGFWKAPEILMLEGLRRQLTDAERRLFTKKGDIYGFAMTSYEVLTGCHPFEGEVDMIKSDMKSMDDGEKTEAELDKDAVGELIRRVTEGHRPQFPDFLFKGHTGFDLVFKRLKRLIERCWDGDASKRPTIETVLRVLEAIRVMQPATYANVGLHGPVKVNSDTDLDLYIKLITRDQQGVERQPTLTSGGSFIMEDGKGGFLKIHGGLPIGRSYADRDPPVEEQLGPDLAYCIDWNRVECLNQKSDHPFRNALDKAYWEDDDFYLESDSDGQLLLNIAFNEMVKLQSLIIRGPPEDLGPKTVKLFANRPNMDFNNVDVPATETVVASPENLEGKPIPLQPVKFRSVEKLTVFVEDNQEGGKVTRLQQLAFHGSRIQTTNMKNFCQGDVILPKFYWLQRN